MRVKKSIIVPIVAILSGVLLQLNTLGLTGDLIPTNILLKLWPLLLVAAGLDLLFAQHRMIASLIVLFFAAALLSTQFLESGWDNEIWQIFLKYWPILLILFGIDMIFSGNNLFNAIVIAIAVVAIIYILLTTLDVPVIRDLPIDLSKISSIIPADDIRRFFLEPASLKTPDAGVSDTSSAEADVPPILTGSKGKIRIAMPAQKQVKLNIRPASGRFSLKAGSSDQYLDGTVKLNKKEQLATEASLNGKSAVYTIGSEGSGQIGDSSDWDLALSPNRKTGVNVKQLQGYLKADLRGLKLSGVSLENKSGPIDVMTPNTAGATIKIKAGNGDIRVYIPKDVYISCSIQGASNVEYPENHYTFSDESLSPRTQVESPVLVEIVSNNGQVRIIESE